MRGAGLAAALRGCLPQLVKPSLPAVHGRDDDSSAELPDGGPRASPTPSPSKVRTREALPPTPPPPSTAAAAVASGALFPPSAAPHTLAAAYPVTPAATPIAHAVIAASPGEQYAYGASAAGLGISYGAFLGGTVSTGMATEPYIGAFTPARADTVLLAKAASPLAHGGGAWDGGYSLT